VNAEGKPYAGNPHVRFDEGLLARALRTAGWGLLHHQESGETKQREASCDARPEAQRGAH
jgi:hypothetical protein